MPKRIIFCSDGTWNDPATNTNVYKIFKAMNFTAEQCPLYDDGVGSDGNTILHFLGGAFGEGLDQKLRDGYTRYSAKDNLQSIRHRLRVPRVHKRLQSGRGSGAHSVESDC